MDLAFTNGQMAGLILVNTKKIKKKALASIVGKMVEDMKVIGIEVNSMVLDLTLFQRNNEYILVFGKMERE